MAVIINYADWILRVRKSAKIFYLEMNSGGEISVVKYWRDFG